jgi:hypothetical protein
MTLGEFFVNWGPMLLMIVLLAAFSIWMARSTGGFMRRRAQEAREMRDVMETLVVPEMRAIKNSIDAVTAEMKLAREESEDRRSTAHRDH